MSDCQHERTTVFPATGTDTEKCDDCGAWNVGGRANGWQRAAPLSPPTADAPPRAPPRGPLPVRTARRLSGEELRDATRRLSPAPPLDDVGAEDPTTKIGALIDDLVIAARTCGIGDADGGAEEPDERRESSARTALLAEYERVRASAQCEVSKFTARWEAEHRECAALRSEVITERRCRLANEQEMRRADTEIGALRTEYEQTRKERDEARESLADLRAETEGWGHIEDAAQTKRDHEEAPGRYFIVNGEECHLTRARDAIGQRLGVVALRELLDRGYVWSTVECRDAKGNLIDPRTPVDEVTGWPVYVGQPIGWGG
jgi:hypothetical protein